MRRILTTDVVSLVKHRWFYAKRTKETNHLVRYVYNQIQFGGSVNVRVAAQHYYGNLIRKSVFNKRLFRDGSKDEGPGLEEEEHVYAIFRILHYLFSFCASDFFFPCLRWKFDLDGHERP
ncbi:hypothetical protein Ddye_013171 [Dipteronia dyeriana]|uniref:Uncharacterized protein n=1 Tax=Dipteronia dyeriana TaxID=168575 RepID=A0AAD9X5T8_9ROSI|nr:hypothetical protein Ddye_013171 [Dipteronia dyeriana]